MHLDFDVKFEMINCVKYNCQQDEVIPNPIQWPYRYVGFKVATIG